MQKGVLCAKILGISIVAPEKKWVGSTAVEHDNVAI
jgi:hypothetical protein